MDRQTLAQAAAMLVILSALVRWLPAPSAEEASTDPLGRGEPWFVLRLDLATLEDWRGEGPVARALGKRAVPPPEAELGALTEDGVRARWLGLVRAPGWSQRAFMLLQAVRRLHERAAPGDVVQLRGFWRNETWMLRYYLHPLVTAGGTREEGDGAGTPVLPQAAWVLTSGEIDEAPRLERGPAEPAPAEPAPGEPVPVEKAPR